MATLGAGDERARDGEAREAPVMPFRLQTQSLAVGRLGPIHRALEIATGRVVTIERVDLAAGLDASSEDVERVRDMLQTELDAQREHLPGVLWYDAAVVDCHSQARPALLLVSRASAGQTLAQLSKEFGRLHPLIVRQYVHALLQSVAAIHERGLSCGGLSSSTVFIGADGSLLLGACFPSFPTVRFAAQSGVLADASVCHAALQRPLATHETAQDVRSVAYVMTEMLTGRRARGASLLDPSRLVSSVGLDDQQHVAFLRELLASDRVTREICQHPFLPARAPPRPTDSAAGGDAVLAVSAALQEQRRMVVALTRDELAACQAQTREATQQMRAWFRGFERQYGRKPTADDRPTTIVRLQARCRALADRAETLNARLSAVFQSFRRASAPEEAPSALPFGNDTAGAAPTLVAVEIPRLDDAQAATEAQSRAGTRRSPAQHAFLSRHQEAGSAAVAE